MEKEESARNINYNKFVLLNKMAEKNRHNIKEKRFAKSNGDKINDKEKPC